MSRKILIISTSLRAKSNSDLLAQAFMKGALEAGHQVEKVSLRGKNIAFCRGCLACQKLGKCVIPDDANEITEKMKTADVIVWATPIYYYEMSGAMKTMIDRANALFAANPAFRDVYLLSSAADDDPHADERALQGLGGWIACYEKSRLAGSVLACGVTDEGEAEGSEALRRACELGRTLQG